MAHRSLMIVLKLNEYIGVVRSLERIRENVYGLTGNRDYAHSSE